MMKSLQANTSLMFPRSVIQLCAVLAIGFSIKFWGLACYTWRTPLANSSKNGNPFLVPGLFVRMWYPVGMLFPHCRVPIKPLYICFSILVLGSFYSSRLPNVLFCFFFFFKITPVTRYSSPIFPPLPCLPSPSQFNPFYPIVPFSILYYCALFPNSWRPLLNY